jgi:hypothetical protein
VKQLIRDKIAAVNAAASKPAVAAATAGRVGNAAAAAAAAQTSGLQRATSITIGLVFHVISDTGLSFTDTNGQTYPTAPHRTGSDLPTCGHLMGTLPCASHMLALDVPVA